MNKWIFRAIILCILIIVMVTSCNLKFREDDYYFIPAYRMETLDNGKIITYSATRYSVRNYWIHKKQFEKEALTIVCNEINDSIPVTLLDVAFQAGKENDAFNKAICTYRWSIENPDSIKVSKGKGAEYIIEMIPFNCVFNEKYKMINDVK